METSNDIDKKKVHATLGMVFLTIFVSMIGFGIVIPVLPTYAKSEPFMLVPMLWAGSRAFFRWCNFSPPRCWAN